VIQIKIDLFLAIGGKDTMNRGRRGMKSKTKTSAQIIGYVPVSTTNKRQTVENHKLAMSEFCRARKLHVADWIEANASSCRTTKHRRVDELLHRLKPGDTLIVSDLSRLARSVGQQIAILVDTLLRNKVRVICIKEGIDLNGEQNIQSEIRVTMFSLFAEIERDLLSERTKEGLRRARAQGKLLGRPKGSLGKSKLDGKETEIKRYLSLGVNKTNIACIFQVGWTTLDHFIRTRGLR
jgi:DNA invertase Pin-like site-specific DNA recombinase